jgi:hypothetical protein
LVLRNPMKRTLFSLCLSLVTGALVAQTPPTEVTVAIPPLTAPASDVSPPFPSGAGRYQQWYSAANLGVGITIPRRINRLEFFAGTAPTSQAALIDCEILLGHGRTQGLLGTFDSNWAVGTTPLLVRPRTNVSLIAAASGSLCIDVPLVNTFVWDQISPVVMEIRVYGNTVAGLNPFSYNFRGATTAFGISRVYGGGSPLAVTGNVLTNTGMVTRFTARLGATLPFGFGCPGEGNFIPRAVVSNLGWPGVTWNHQLQQAASQQFAFWVIGDQDIQATGVDLLPLFGLPPANCLLLTNLLNVIGTSTAGGGAGTGIATLSVVLPPTTSYVGASLYTQWVVFDPLAPSGLLSVTAGNRSVIAPVGG